MRLPPPPRAISLTSRQYLFWHSRNPCCYISRDQRSTMNKSGQIDHLNERVRDSHKTRISLGKSRPIISRVNGPYIFMSSEQL